MSQSSSATDLMVVLEIALREQYCFDEFRRLVSASKVDHKLGWQDLVRHSIVSSDEKKLKRFFSLRQTSVHCLLLH